MSIPILSKKPDKDITSVAFKNGTLREYQGFSSRFSHISSLGRGGSIAYWAGERRKVVSEEFKKFQFPAQSFKEDEKMGRCPKLNSWNIFFVKFAIFAPIEKVVI